MSFWTSGSSNRRPIRRLVANRVFSGLTTACRLAGTPTSRSPSLVKATTEGVVRLPSAFSITLGVLPSMMATAELVVPRSIPMTAPWTFPELNRCWKAGSREVLRAERANLEANIVCSSFLST
ncbi:hypothetical protein B0I72DRAFT_142933 [Yarrowia lipolytica]|uniref:Uncharacterized protein n=1 Tax=Yarrowia lipolytica TaxID=4952 RepID=A0A371BXL0_YARLL|nr:hypothetical protein BKA91DRAFT_136354 [Yarrowia lipolytica]KAE8172244.1 hypothetical protein BKA90DRAFT_137758 [Yarrowia lipolytica]RDW22823.1 hypothetical protein B0I71DRAFT_136945 [Yarrowia lipolytica]RDW29582.1 hypothetical protein B0I72DRAFT_142933 [Yarrowia lipolytica]RDW36514.1 hypothetical protein B0I73DRAFT_137000 [Yarrowia lipolytica]